MEKISPLSQSKRIDLVDALRGFAIFGILMVNMPLMFTPLVEEVMMPSFGEELNEIAANIFIDFFFTGKFFVLFSLLFGFGFYVFLHKDGEPGKEIVGVFRRRLFWLLVFGTLHVTFLWEGDILIYYALFGFLLLLFRNSSIRKLSIWMIIFLLIPTAFFGLIALLPILFGSNQDFLAAFEEGNQQQLIQTKELVARAYEIYSQGTYTEIIQMNWEQWSFLVIGVFVFYPICMAMFLLGLIIGKKGLFSKYTEHLALYRKIFWYGLIIGIPFNLLFVLAMMKSQTIEIDLWELMGAFSSMVGGIAFMGVYVSGLVLLYSKGKFSKLFSGFSAVGRMALTNYLSHSLIALFLFRSVGLGWYGELEDWHAIVLTLLIFGFQIPFSKWWLGRFRYGPLEWLWRTLTYGKKPAFKL